STPSARFHLVASKPKSSGQESALRALEAAFRSNDWAAIYDLSSSDLKVDYTRDAFVRAAAAQQPSVGTVTAVVRRATTIPASKIGMAGAERLRDVSAERFNTVDGPQPAFTGALWGSQEDFTRVYDYYRLQLPPLGWTADRDAILASGEYLGKLWCKPTMLF